MSTVSLHGVSKTFGQDNVVHQIDLDVHDGEFLVLVGPSGCGKSTTLRMIAGLESISEGTIAIDGRTVNDVHPADRDVAMVFQSYALYPHMSVYDNMAYGLKRRRLARDEIGRRVATTAAMLKLDMLLDRRPSQLSGGQRQRVALGRAIVREPAVFLMDEPLSNLDAKLRVETRSELARLHTELSVTTIYVTHDQVEAMTMGTRIVVMNAGRIEQIGPPLDLYRRPETLFVARFLGLPEIDLITGNVRGDGRSAVFESRDLPAIPLPPMRDGAATIGLRPQTVTGTVNGEIPPGGFALGMADVIAIEHHGPESFATCRVGTMPITVQVDPGIHVADRLHLSADLSALHIFDPKSERRITVGDVVQTEPKG